MDSARLLAFIGAFALVALSPGLCMTLSMTLGIRIGVRRTLWMMAGELTGIALVAASAMLGVAALLLQSPGVFAAFKLAGAAYLFYSGWQAWKSGAADPSALADPARERSRGSLATQGFLTAVGNPKAWAFQVALLPPFLDAGRALAPQMAALLAVMVVIEFLSLLTYAWGGRRLAAWLASRGHARVLNRVSACLMFGVGAWLALS